MNRIIDLSYFCLCERCPTDRQCVRHQHCPPAGHQLWHCNQMLLFWPSLAPSSTVLAAEIFLQFSVNSQLTYEILSEYALQKKMLEKHVKCFLIIWSSGLILLLPLLFELSGNFCPVHFVFLAFFCRLRLLTLSRLNELFFYCSGFTIQGTQIVHDDL